MKTPKQKFILTTLGLLSASVLGTSLYIGVQLSKTDNTQSTPTTDTTETTTTEEQDSTSTSEVKYNLSPSDLQWGTKTTESEEEETTETLEDTQETFERVPLIDKEPYEPEVMVEEPAYESADVEMRKDLNDRNYDNVTLTPGNMIYYFKEGVANTEDIKVTDVLINNGEGLVTIIVTTTTDVTPEDLEVFKIEQIEPIVARSTVGEERWYLGSQSISIEED